MSAVADALRNARELYAANPSHTMEPLPTGGTTCPVTAITHATDMFEGDHVYRAAYKAFVVASGAERGGVWLWNAEHSTDEVLVAFDRAIALVSS